MTLLVQVQVQYSYKYKYNMNKNHAPGPSSFFFVVYTTNKRLFPSLHAYPAIDIGAPPMAHHRRNFSNERLSPMNAAGGSSTFGGFSQAAVVQFGLCVGQLINSVYNVLAQVVSKDGAHPIVFSFYRDIIATPILFAAAWYFDGGVRWPRQEDIPRVVAQGEIARRRRWGEKREKEGNGTRKQVCHVHFLFLFSDGLM